MKYEKIMQAEMDPDLYAGQNFNELRPRWKAYAEGDMDHDYMEVVSLDSRMFHPGTKIVVLEPVCPKCKQIVSICGELTGCDFDWDAWVNDRYS